MDHQAANQAADLAFEAIGYQRHNRVRNHTAPQWNARIDRKTAERIRYFADQPREVLTRRIDALEREWDLDRIMELTASTAAFGGLVLGFLKNKAWFMLPALVLPFLFQHATQGWSPSAPVLRRLGVRTQSEIDSEKYALKALRGDFAEVFKLDIGLTGPVRKLPPESQTAKYRPG